MQVCDSDRLIIRHFNETDAEFVIKQLNEKSFIENIDDKNIRNRADAKDYLRRVPMASYRKYGYGLNILILKQSNTPIGMCGLINRDELQYPDLGYAVLSDYSLKGYAYEACRAVLHAAHLTHSIRWVSAVTTLQNIASNQLLKKLGFACVGQVKLYGKQSNLYETDLAVLDVKNNR